MKYINKETEDSINRANKLEDWKKWRVKKRQKPSYSGLKSISTGYSRRDLKQDLWEEQGGICCYCGQSIPQPTIQTGTSSIEHIITQAESKKNNTEEDISYKNMILSCRGRQYEELEENQNLEEFSHSKSIDLEIVTIKNAVKILDSKGRGKIGFVDRSVDHCNEKRKSDTKIINPTDIKYNSAETDCWRLFEYNCDDGSICIIKSKNSDTLTTDTIDVLGLDCDLLKKKRGKMYQSYENIFLYIEDNEYDDGSRKGIKKKERTWEDRINYFKKQLQSKPQSFYPMFYSIMLGYFERKGIVI